MRTWWSFSIFVVGITVLSIGSAAGEGYLFEDFSGTLTDQWMLYGSPSSGINPSIGNPAPSFFANGDGNYDSGIASLATFDFSAGLIIETDIFVARDSGFDPGISFGLLNPDNRGWNSIGPEGDYSVLLRYAWSSVNGWEGHLAAHALPPSGVWSTGIFWPNTNEFLDDWHRFRIEILPTQHVVFSIDGVPIYSPATPLDLKYSNMPVLVGRKRTTAFGDNVLILEGDHVIALLVNQFGLSFQEAEALFLEYGDEELRTAIAEALDDLDYLMAYLNGDLGCPPGRLVLDSVNANGSVVTLTVRNAGSGTISGVPELVVGLSYDTSWVPEWETHFFSQEFAGAFLYSGDTLDLTFELPDIPQTAIGALAEQLTDWWTGYLDKDLESDYVGMCLQIGESNWVFGFLPY